MILFDTSPARVRDIGQESKWMQSFMKCLARREERQETLREIDDANMVFPHLTADLLPCKKLYEICDAYDVGGDENGGDNDDADTFESEANFSMRFKMTWKSRAVSQSLSFSSPRLHLLLFDLMPCSSCIAISNGLSWQSSYCCFKPTRTRIGLRIGI
jgi:hypothetical protein